MVAIRIHEPAKPEGEGASRLSEIDQKSYEDALNTVRQHCEILALGSALDQIQRIDITIKAGSMYGAYITFSQQVIQLLWCIEADLAKRLFIFLPPTQSEYYEQEELFGADVGSKFPRANKEVTAAGNCYATGNFTACVFHLMRALEISLHALACNLNVHFPATIELENWNNIIEKIESATRDRQKQLPKGTQKSDYLQFYAEAAKEFHYFKDAWRNHVSHSRGDYDILEAQKILEHTKYFMKHLAQRCSE